MFYTETTGLIITKILHDIVALVSLFNHAYTRRRRHGVITVRFWKPGRQNCGVFQIFKMAAAILLDIWVEKVEKHQHAKFC